MTPNEPTSLPLVQHDATSNGQREFQGFRTVSPDRVSVTSSANEASVNNIEEDFIKKPRPSRIGSTFQRWKRRQQRPVSSLLLFAIAAIIAVMFRISAPNINEPD